jgi:hypothetical protein
MRALVRLVVFVAVVAVLAGGAAAWFGVVQVPVLSSAFGMDKAADLGAARPDVAAYDAFVKKHGLVHASPDANYTLASKHTFAGSYALDELIPEAVILATRTLRGNAPSFHDVTVRFHKGSAEAAAFVDLSPYGYPLAGPVRAGFRVDVTGPRSVKVSIDSLSFGRLGVPGDILARAQDGVNAYLATRLAGIDGLRIDTFAFEEGGVRFAGTLPKTYGADAPKAGDLP